jgi:hypothetical protein
VSKTDFWMFADGVADQARAFEQWSQMATSAHDWVDSHPLTDAAEHPAYSRGATAAIGVRDGLIGWFDHLSSVLDGVAVELRGVAEESKSIDLEEQARIDATDPDGYLGYEKNPSGKPDIAPEGDRADSLLFPVYPPPNGGAAFYCDLGPAYDHLNDLSKGLVPGDLLSPSEWVMTVLGWLGADSLSEQVLKAFGGRWGDLRQFADTLTGLASMAMEMHDGLKSAASALAMYWQGFAANSAQAYLAALLDAINTAADELTTAGESFQSYCDGVEAAAEAIGGQMHAFLDAVIFAAVAAGLGTATIETAVGGAIGYSAAGLALLRAYMVLYEVRDTLQQVEDLIGVLDAIAATTQELGDFVSTIPVPTMEDAK